MYKMFMKPTSKVITLFLVIISQAWAGSPEQRDFSTSDITKLVMFGTGTPMPDPAHNGPAVGIVVNGQIYLVDVGTGIWHGLGREMPRYGGAGAVDGLSAQNIALNQMFITHLHSDHTLGLPSVILSPWTLGKTTPPHIYGPPGTKDMIEYILKAYRRDIDFRVYSPSRTNNTGWRAVGHDLPKPGLVYEDENVKVTAFPVCHSHWPEAYAYRFVTPDRVITVSGDTRPCPGMEDAARDVDILVYSVYSEVIQNAFPHPKNPEKTRRIKQLSQSSSREVAELAKRVNPGLLVLYHEQIWTGDPEQNVKEIREAGYTGKVIASRDRDVF